MTAKCAKCGSRGWRIAWDGAERVWYCVRRLPFPDPAGSPKPARSRAARRDPAATAGEVLPDADLAEIVCPRCAQVLARVLPGEGTAVWCRRCRRWCGS